MRREGGFTLVEVVVALTLAAFVVLAAHRIFAGVMDGVQRLGEARRSLDREANARELLSALVGSIDVERQAGFHGQPQQAAFTTWHADSLGRAVRRRIVLRWAEASLTLQGVYPEPLRLVDGVSTVAFDYLLQLGADERFVREWHSDASAPAAIRLRITRPATTDTLLLLVGWRG